jgi:hypothetical protein
MSNPDRLVTARWEGDRHLDALQGALEDWRFAPAADLRALEADREKMRILDQILFRFTKLQDAMGSRLVPATLDALSEPFEEWPMIDRLNRLERLGYIRVDDWLRWRETRNRLAHEYPENLEIRFAAITAAIDAATELSTAYQLWRRKLASLP